MADFNDLRNKALAIRDEVKAGANTANRVGAAIKGAVDAIEEEYRRAISAEQSLSTQAGEHTNTLTGISKELNSQGADIQSLQGETRDLPAIRANIANLAQVKADKTEVAKKQDALQLYSEDFKGSTVEIFSQCSSSLRCDTQGGEASVVCTNDDSSATRPIASIVTTLTDGKTAYVTIKGDAMEIKGKTIMVSSDNGTYGDVVEAINANKTAIDKATAKVTEMEVKVAKITANHETLKAKVDLLQEQLIPTAMVVTAPKTITYGNLAHQYVAAHLKGERTLNNIIYQCDNESVRVLPTGKIEVLRKGRSRVWVIPTGNTSLTEQIEIEVVQPGIRTAHGGMRMLGGGGLRFT